MTTKAQPTASDVRDALREYFSAKAAAEKSPEAIRLLAATRRVNELYCVTDPIDTNVNNSVSYLIATYGAELFTDSSSFPKAIESSARTGAP